MLAANHVKTKKLFKELSTGKLAVDYLRETSLVGRELSANCTVNVVGSSEYERKWYGTVVVVDGLIQGVK